jgi:hypothetical protein
MIISRPIVQRLSPAIKEASQQASDGTVLVPSLFSFTGMPSEPISVQGGLGATNNTSAMVQVAQQVANAVQSTQGLMTLTSGWWRMKFTGSYRSNYVLATNAVGDYRLILQIDGSTNVVLFARHATALLPAQGINVEYEFVFRSTASFTSVLDANGVGQEHSVAGTFLAMKLL